MPPEGSPGLRPLSDHVLSPKRMLPALLLCLLTLPPTFAQNSSDPPLTHEPAEQASQGEGGPVQFRTRVDQVVLYASIYDRKNQLVSGLPREDFTVYEDSVEQELTYFGQDDVPSTVGMVIDSSGSMRNKYELVNEGSELFLSMNNPLNELFLVSFKDEATLEEDFTQDVEDIEDALFNIIISGGTALYDAIFLAVDRAREGSELKKTVIVFTDGEDRDSYYTLEELLEKIRESDVQVYVIAFLDFELSNRGGFFGVFSSDREKVQDKISSIADHTGGKAFFPEQIGQLKEIFRSIAYEMRHQYRLAYISSNPAQNDDWRKIDVVLKNAKTRGLKVRAKKGYYIAGKKTSGTQ